MNSELQAVKTEVGAEAFAAKTMEKAVSIFERLVFDPEFREFLTTMAYEQLG